MQRCPWPYLENSPIYQDYHDNEWGKPKHNDQQLFEKLILEIFQAGLSWLTILKKRECFREAFDYFDIEKISKYDESKIMELMNNKNIVRNQRKIEATIHNAKLTMHLIEEFGSFDNYIWSFSNEKILIDESLEQKELFSLVVYKDFKNRGFKHVGKVTTYSYLESIGVMDNHNKDCFLYKGSK